MKKITILGSTGSIGTQTLEVVRTHPQEFKIYALTAGTNMSLLEQQVREFHPAYACLWEAKAAKELRMRLKGCSTKVVYGMEGLVQCATEPEVQLVVAAMVGMIGLRPVLAAVEKGKDIALANKETLVTAGHLMMPLARQKGVSVFPVDSEHSAIDQCLQGLAEPRRGQLDCIYLTASGGPFRKKGREELRHVSVEQALAHPNWNMGRKITIDSASMMNKGLEVIEARWLFDVEFSKIKVLIQPQSIIHSMVQFVDGAVLAQLGTPDMKLPIQYALTGRKRLGLSGERLDFEKLSSIHFERPDTEILRGLPIAYGAGIEGGSMPTVMNAANECAVAAFLNRKIEFLDIYRMIEYAMEHHKTIPNPDLDEILKIEGETYQRLKEWRK